MLVGSSQEPQGRDVSSTRDLDPADPVPPDPPEGPDSTRREGDRTPVQSESASHATVRLSLGMPTMKGDFRPLRQLGSGSFGEVWLAEEWVDGRNFRRVAVKFLDKGQEQAAAALYLEASRLATLAGKGGIVQIHDVVLDAERPYFTMDYAAEGSLAGLLSSLGSLPVPRALAIFRGIVEALEALHFKGIIHCDLKPENILLGDRHEPMIADFGQARLRGKGPPNIGSWFYMAPEQIGDDRSHDAETSCDVYALGAIFYKMLTGKEPRAGEEARRFLQAELSVREKLQAHREWIVNAPKPVEHHRVAEIDQPLRSIIDRCLETEPTRRFRDGSEVRTALEQRERSLRKRPLIVRGLGATAALMAALLGVLLGVIPLILSTFREAYIGESLRRDSIAARLASDVVEDILLDRKTLTASWATDPEVCKSFAAHDEPALHRRLHALLEGKRDEKSEVTDFEVRSISAYDRQGTRVAIVADDAGPIPPESDALGHVLWNWRDYFNGRGRDQPPTVEPYPPVEVPSISSPYVGFWNIRGKVEGSRAVTFSAPIRDPGQKAGLVRGVLALTFRVERLFPWIHDAELLKHGLVAIVDDEGYCVWHEDLGEGGEDLVAGTGSESFPQVKDNAIRLLPSPSTTIRRSYPKAYPTYKDGLKALRHKGEAGVEPTRGPRGTRDANTMEIRDFVDPINGRSYFASFAYLPRTRWGLLVQHDRNDALAALVRLDASVRLAGWISYAAVLALVVGLWSVILRRWRREERFAHA
jgi:eukaryotic-like serine/threonine-protein kinase